MYNAGLILEGGGMRGVYTAGVLDAFLDAGIEFSCIWRISRKLPCMQLSFKAKRKSLSGECGLSG